MMEEILLRLPVKSLGRFRCVSKELNTSISNPVFTKLHLNHQKSQNKNLLKIMLNENCDYYKVDFDILDKSEKKYNLEYIDENRLNIVGYCDGFMYLWNPTTRKYRLLPHVASRSCYYSCIYSFGIDPSTVEYKVLFLESCMVELELHTKFHLYTTHTNSWRRMGDIPFFIYTDEYAHVNGNIHYLAKRSFDSRGPKLILSFNIKDTEFREVPQPNYSTNGKSKITITLTSLEESLCLFFYYSAAHRRMHKNWSVDLWMMKDYGVKESWVKLACIYPKSIDKSIQDVQPLHLWENGQYLLHVTSSTRRQHMALYDSKKNEGKTLHICNVPYMFISRVYEENLISPKAGTYDPVEEHENSVKRRK
ncbi:hypothetical protein AQUCO_01500337v1, partial [Aquilegia coerulea]